MDAATIKSLRVVDLKEALTALGLSTKGRKAELVSRLTKYYDNLEKESAEKESVTTESQAEASSSAVEPAQETKAEPVQEEPKPAEEPAQPVEETAVAETPNEEPQQPVQELEEPVAEPVPEPETEVQEESTKVEEEYVVLQNQTINEEPASAFEEIQPEEIVEAQAEIQRENSVKESQAVEVQEEAVEEVEAVQEQVLEEAEPVQQEPAQEPENLANDDNQMVEDEQLVQEEDQPAEPEEQSNQEKDDPVNDPPPVENQPVEILDDDMNDNTVEEIEDDEVEPYEQQVISPPAYADLDEEEKNDPEMQLLQVKQKLLEEEYKNEQEREAQMEDLSSTVAKTQTGQSVVLETIIKVEPERLQAMEDFKAGKISKNKLKKIKAKLAKKAKKERDMKAFRASLRADVDTSKARKRNISGKRSAKPITDIEIEYVSKQMEVGDIFAAPADCLYPQDEIERTRDHYNRILNKFILEEDTIEEKVEQAILDAKDAAKKMGAHYKEPKDWNQKDDEKETKKDSDKEASDEEEMTPERQREIDEQKMSKRKLKEKYRPTLSALKQMAQKPDVVEMHDVTSADPRLLVHLKGYRNLVPVPRHWCLKRRYLTSKRGFEKPPFELPEFIKRTGISEIRDALLEKDEIRNRASKQRQKMRPKLGKIHMDYEKLHDAFFRYQTKPNMTLHGDLYYEGKELEVKLKEKKPGELSDQLRIALGMPIGPHAHRCPPPWLIAMQRYGPPPTFPNLKIPGLNAPIPPGCSFGYHAGGWGKPPVDEYGRPLYGDVFGTQNNIEEEDVDQGKVNFRWGQLESDSESESSEEEEEEEMPNQGEVDSDEEMEAEQEETKPDPTRSEGYGAQGMATPSGISTSEMSARDTGYETPQQIQLRKRHEIESAMEQKEHKDLFKVVGQKATGRDQSGAGRGTMMGSTHTYDLSSRKRTGKMGRDGVEVPLTPEELAMDEAKIRARLEEKMRAKQRDMGGEDNSDLLRDHLGQTDRKRRREMEQRNRDGYEKRRR